MDIYRLGCALTVLRLAMVWLSAALAGLNMINS
jgi:hypothetical protein